MIARINSHCQQGSTQNEPTIPGKDLPSAQAQRRQLGLEPVQENNKREAYIKQNQQGRPEPAHVDEDIVVKVNCISEAEEEEVDQEEAEHDEQTTNKPAKLGAPSSRQPPVKQVGNDGGKIENEVSPCQGNLSESHSRHPSPEKRPRPE